MTYTLRFLPEVEEDVINGRGGLEKLDREISDKAALNGSSPAISSIN